MAALACCLRRAEKREGSLSGMEVASELVDIVLVWWLVCSLDDQMLWLERMLEGRWKGQLEVKMEDDEGVW